MLDGGDWQRAIVGSHQPAHHRGLPPGPEGIGRFAGALDADQGIDHCTALDQQTMHLRIDRVDLPTQLSQCLRVAVRGF